jgi:hypothetical protein
VKEQTTNAGNDRMPVMANTKTITWGRAQCFEAFHMFARTAPLEVLALTSTASIHHLSVKKTENTSVFIPIPTPN